MSESWIESIGFSLNSAVWLKRGVMSVKNVFGILNRDVILGDQPNLEVRELIAAR